MIVQHICHDVGIGAVPVGHIGRNVYAAGGANQELRRFRAKLVAAETRRICDGDCYMARRIGERPRCVLSAERTLAGARHRVLRRDGGFVDDGNVSAVAAAFKLEH